MPTEKWIGDEPELKGFTRNFMTNLQGEPYDMYSVRFETDCIDELYKRLSNADVNLEPIHEDQTGLSFVYADFQGNKYQVWQNHNTETQPLQDDVPALIGIVAIFLPVSDLKVTHRWYTEFLGLHISEAGHPVTGTGQELILCQRLDPGKTLNYPGQGPLSMINIKVEGMDELHRRMMDNEQVVQENINDREGCGRSFLLSDPDGNKLEIWEAQTMIMQRNVEGNSSDWKDRFNIFFDFQMIDVSTFMQKAIDGSPKLTKRIQILDHAKLCETDPEGLKELVETLEQYSEERPDKAFNIVFREGPSLV